MGRAPGATGWQAALLEGRLPCAPACTRRLGAPGPVHEAGQVLARDLRVTAVLCGSYDELAFGVARAMNEAGRSVPASVSIVGFDDSPAAAFYSPALTTVRLDFRALDGTCFAKLLTILGRQPGTANAKGLTARSGGPGKFRPTGTAVAPGEEALANGERYRSGQPGAGLTLATTVGAASRRGRTPAGRETL